MYTLANSQVKARCTYIFVYVYVYVQQCSVMTLTRVLELVEYDLRQEAVR